MELAKFMERDRIHFGKRLVRIKEQPNGKVILHFKDGSQAFADCLIGADGIHSTTRGYLLGEDHAAREAKNQGWVLFRRQVPMEEAALTVEAKLLHKVPIYCGLAGAVNCMPIHGGRTYSISVCCTRTPGSDEGLVFSKDFFKDWIPEVRTVVEVSAHPPSYGFHNARRCALIDTCEACQ